MDSITILPILKKIPLLEDLNATDHGQIIEHITLNYFPANYTLFSEGDIGEKLYILKSGMVKIFHPDKPDQPIAMLGPNEFFGEMALFEDRKRTASAMTTSDSEIFLLEKTDFYDLVLKNQNIASKLSDEFLNRVKGNQKRLDDEGKH